MSVSDLREYVLTLGVRSLEPGEKAEFSVTPTLIFRATRLVIAPPPDPKWWKLRCFLLALFVNIVFFLPILAKIFFHQHWTWRRFYEPPPSTLVITDFKVAGRPQISGVSSGIPADIFFPEESAGLLAFETADVCEVISMTVQNVGKKTAVFKGLLAGVTVG